MSTPYDFVSDERRPGLEHLLGAVPEAREKFEEGKVLEAFRLLRAAEHAQLEPAEGESKGAFLMMIELRMPNMYS